MRRVLLLLAVVACLGMAGCAGKPAQTKLTVSTSFDKETAEKQMRPGNNTIKGSALLRQVGGGVITCAGSFVTLLPYSNHAQERMTALFLDERGGINEKVLSDAFLGPDVYERDVITPFEPEYLKFRKESQCDAQGYFSFNNLADGDYYIYTSVEWGTNTSGIGVEGGMLMKKVHVEGGETKEIVINGKP